MTSDTRVAFIRSNATPLPDPRGASPDGLVAVGGDLSVPRLVEAYAKGIFPWFSSDAEPVLWWSPTPRALVWTRDFRPSRSLRKVLRNGGFEVTMDTAFADVVARCSATPRRDSAGTWITPSMFAAYSRLHREGFAHSVETWCDGELVGGLYGVSLGSFFFGESMFTTVSNASKVAFARLVEQLQRWQFDVVDCQIMNDHLRSLGAVDVPRGQFLDMLEDLDLRSTRRGVWHLEPAHA